MLIVQRDSNHRFARDQFDGLDLGFQRVNRIARKAVVLGSGRSMLQHNDVWSPCCQKLEASRIGGVHQAALSFQQDHFRVLFVPCRPYGMLDFASYEVVDQGVQDDSEASTLHPGGLSGTYKLCRAASDLQSVSQHPGGCTFSDRRVRSQHSDFQARDFLDLAAEEVHILDWRGLSHITNRHTTLSCGSRDLGIFAQELVQTRVDIQTCMDGIKHTPSSR